MQPKVSIIIPVWSEPESDGALLRRVFDCSVNQTLEGIEIIAVNDKSPNPLDYAIMEEYENRYPGTFTCLYLPGNIGQGGARNRGLDIANGEYVTFVDDDDIIDLTFCEVLYTAAISSDADIAGCAWFHSGGKRTYSRPLSYKAEGWLNFSNMPWSKLVNRKMLIQNRLCFLEISLLEDIATYFWAVYSKKTVFVNKALYFWNTRENSRSLGGDIWFNDDFKNYITPFSRYIEKMNLFHDTETYTFSALHLLKQLITFARNYFAVGGTELRIDLVNCFNSLYSQIDFSRLSEDVNKKYSEIFSRYRKLEGKADTDEGLSLFEKWINDIRNGFKRHAYSDNLLLLYQHLQAVQGNQICLWGSGKNGFDFAKLLSDMNVQFEITDINPEAYGKIMPHNVTVKSWDTVKHIVQTVLVCTSAHYDDVCKRVGKKYLVVDLYEYLLSELSPVEYLATHC